MRIEESFHLLGWVLPTSWIFDDTLSCLSSVCFSYLNELITRNKCEEKLEQFYDSMMIHEVSELGPRILSWSQPYIHNFDSTIFSVPIYGSTRSNEEYLVACDLAIQLGYCKEPPQNPGAWVLRKALHEKKISS